MVERRVKWVAPPPPEIIRWVTETTVAQGTTRNAHVQVSRVLTYIFIFELDCENLTN